MLVSSLSRRIKCPRTVNHAFPRSITDDITQKMNLSPTHYNLFQIGAKVKITHNVKMFRISLPSPESVVDFKSIPSYIVVKADGKGNMKDGMCYCPFSYSDQKGSIDILVKSKVEDSVSEQLHGAEEGDFLSVKGPFPYDNFHYKANMCNTIHMIAGGSGISVMLQIIREIFRHEESEDRTKVRLLYANKSEEDAALRVALDDLHFNLPHRFEVTYLFENEVEGSNSVLSNEYLPRLSGDDQPSIEEEEEDGEEHEYVMVPQMIKSKITPEVVEAFLNDSFADSGATEGGGRVSASADDKPLVLLCGPPRMIELLAGKRGHRCGGEEAARGVLGELGYKAESVVTL